MSEAKYWTLEQCVIWIAFRSEEIVSYARGCEQWDTLGDFIRQSQLNDIGLVAFEIDDRINARLRNYPEVQLLEALQQGKVRAFACYLWLGDHELDPSFWQQQYSVLDVKQPRKADDRYIIIRGIYPNEIKKKWPASDDSSAGGPRTGIEISEEEECEEYFRSLGPRSPNDKYRIAKVAQDSAKEMLPGLSDRAIKRAWQRGADETRKKGGRPKLRD